MSLVLGDFDFMNFSQVQRSRWGWKIRSGTGIKSSFIQRTPVSNNFQNKQFVFAFCSPKLRSVGSDNPQLLSWKMLRCVWIVSSSQRPIKLLHFVSKFCMVLTKLALESPRGRQFKYVRNNVGTSGLFTTAVLVGGANHALSTQPLGWLLISCGLFQVDVFDSC